MTYKSANELKVEFKDHSLWVYLNRPEASNAFNLSMINELVRTLKIADQDDSVRTIIISGMGKHFCAGGDVKKMKNKEDMFSGGPNELRQNYISGIQQIPHCFHQLATPVIAMINGAAIGAGLDLACMCDIRISSDKAKFGETFSKLGLIPGDGGSYFLQRVVGFSKAMELSLTAEIFDSSKALSIGLVNSVVGADELLDKTTQLAKKINANSPIASKMLKRSIIHAYRSDLASHLDLLAAYQGITQRTEDHLRALDAIENKSQVHFKHS